MHPPPELLAPAGQPDAGYAALHYGADAVYLGLGRFSARAEAVNFTPDELAAFVDYAHGLPRRRGVYLTLNTVVKQAELAGAADTLLTAAACGVDAVIVQDLGVARLARERFPDLRLHASTQLAIHDLAGALAARRLGFGRVTLARELTLPEVRRIVDESGLEVETFIHGTLCYSYSGLCLFSSLAVGRSGNRGRCVYSCREAAATPAGRLHPFSLKDLALEERVADLARAGVASLKIEGRKKSPLYVAATVDYYRKLLDGAMTAEEAAAARDRLQTIFARPWTRLFLDGPRNADAADTTVVGHRGARIGRVERLVRTPAGMGVAFTPRLAVERHDGLQIDIPGEARPYGFPVDNLYEAKGGRLASTFAGAAGQALAVALPGDAPELAPGLPLYLASSQAVKRAYPFDRPRPGAHGRRLPVRLAVALRRDGEACRIVCRAACDAPAFLRGIPGAEFRSALCQRREETVEALPARDATGAEQAARGAFERLGESMFLLGEWTFENPDALYVRPGLWNRLRRELLSGLADKYRELLALALGELEGFAAAAAVPAEPAADPAFTWAVSVDHPADLLAFPPDELAAIGEIAVTVPLRPSEKWDRDLSALAAEAGRERLRLALPVIMRGAAGPGVDGDPRGSTLHPPSSGGAGSDEVSDFSGNSADSSLMSRVRALHASGWRRWRAAGIGGWHMLDGLADADLAADWPLYALNGLAVRQLEAMRFTSCMLSPEDDAANLRPLLAAHGRMAEVVVYADLPLFISAACAHVHAGLCRPAGGGAGCGAEPMFIRMDQGGPVTVWPTSCGSVVTGQAFSLADKVDVLREMGARRLHVDLRWRPRRRGEALSIWRAVRAGRVDGATPANFLRGLR